MSKDRFPRGRSAIVGAATFGIGEAPGLSSMELAVSASVLALEQAGLQPAAVDGLFSGLPDDFLSGLSLAEYLGISPRVTDNNRTGGSSFLTHAMWAALAIDAGQCDVALIAYGSNQRTAAGHLVSAMRPARHESPYRLPRPVGAYALAASRYMHRYGLTREQLGEVALAARAIGRRADDGDELAAGPAAARTGRDDAAAGEPCGDAIHVRWMDWSPAPSISTPARPADRSAPCLIVKSASSP